MPELVGGILLALLVLLWVSLERLSARWGKRPARINLRDTVWLLLVALGLFEVGCLTGRLLWGP